MTKDEIEVMRAGLQGLGDRLERELGGRIDAVEQRLAARIDAVEQRLSARIDAVEGRMNGVMLGAQQLFRELSERMARLEARVESLTSSVGELAGKLIRLDADVAELTAQVGRLSNDITRGFTVDADRYSGLVKRVEALEAMLRVNG